MTRRRELLASFQPTPVAAVTFAEYLGRCPAPVVGWHKDPHALTLRAGIYVRTLGDVHGDPPDTVAQLLAANWLENH